MPARSKRLDCCLRQISLHHRFFADEENTRRIDCGLHVHAVIHNVGDHLDMSHGLIMCAHHPECQNATLAAQGKRRNDGVQGPLVRSERVGMLGIEHKTCATVGQHDPGFLRADADAEY